MKHFGDFLANLRSSADISQADMAILVDTSRSTISRMENNEIPRPFTGIMRRVVLNLAEILCTSKKETERYLELAEIDDSLLTETEEAQLGFMRQIVQGTQGEKEDLERWERVYEQRLHYLEGRAAALRVSSLPYNLKMRIQEYTNILAELHSRIDRLYNRGEFIDPAIVDAVQIQYAETIEGRVTVGYQYGVEQDNSVIPGNLYSLASSNARWLMQRTNVERFAVDDCIVLTRSRNFDGWNPDEIKTTVLNKPLPIPDDLKAVIQAKIPLIARDYFNGHHYRLAAYTPLYSYRGHLEITLAPLRFYEYYSLTPFLDELLLKGLDGSDISIRQKYGNTALTYSLTEKGTSLIPTPISLQCIVVTKDQQILLLLRSPSVAFYPNHWSASFEKSMNAPGLDRRGNPSRSDNANFFAGALRGLEEELAIPADAVENIKMLSLNVEYLTLSVDIIIFVKVGLTGEEIRQGWVLKAWDMDEASQFDLLSTDLHAVVDKLFSRTLWHPTSRMRLIQYLFHTYGIDEVAKAIKAREAQQT
jgi:transcriptional regulator with XRE-family HTH domain